MDAFIDHGYVHLRGAIPADVAERMHDVLAAELRRNGVDFNDPLTFEARRATKLHDIRAADPTLVDIAPLVAALDHAFGVDHWAPPRDFGQALVTFPNTTRWITPHGLWHLDHPMSTAIDQPSGVNLFCFLHHVEPEGGGTSVLEGSPRMIEQFLLDHPHHRTTKMKAARLALMRSDPWLQRLATEGGVERDDPGVAHGVEVCVRTLHGDAGDVVIAHPWLLHTFSPNATDQVRMQRAARVYRR